MPSHYNNVPKRKKVKSTIEGRVVDKKRVLRPVPQTLAKNKPGVGSVSEYIAETRRRRAVDAAKRIAREERNRRARLTGSFSKAAQEGFIRRKR